MKRLKYSVSAWKAKSQAQNKSQTQQNLSFAPDTSLQNKYNMKMYFTLNQRWRDK